MRAQAHAGIRVKCVAYNTRAPTAAFCPTSATPLPGSSLQVTEREIDAARVGYSPCGDYCSTLFFCIGDLAAIDPMYQYSLPWFVNLFVASVHAAEVRGRVIVRGFTMIQEPLLPMIKNLSSSVSYRYHDCMCVLRVTRWPLLRG